MTVIDQSAGCPSHTAANGPCEYDFWHTDPTGPINGSLRVEGLGWENVTDSMGLSEVSGGGTTAAHFGNIAGRIRAEELSSATMNHTGLHHAISITVNCVTGTANGAASDGRRCVDVPPAVCMPTSPPPDWHPCDPTSVEDAPPMGGRLMLSNITDNDIDGSPQFSQWQKVLLHTMLDYGLIINDTGSGAMFGLQTESNLPYQLQSVPDPWWEMVAGDPAHQLNTCISTRGWETYTASTPNGDLDPGENYCVGKFVGNSLSSIPPDFWLTHLIVAKPRADVVGLSASSGPASGGFQVTIYGHNLGQLFVQFVSHKPGGGGRPALYPRAAPDGQSATFTVPPGPAEVEDLDIGNNSFVNETAQIRIRDAFTFLP